MKHPSPKQEERSERRLHQKRKTASETARSTLTQHAVARETRRRDSQARLRREHGDKGSKGGPLRSKGRRENPRRNTKQRNRTLEAERMKDKMRRESPGSTKWKTPENTEPNEGREEQERAREQLKDKRKEVTLHGQKRKRVAIAPTPSTIDTPKGVIG